MRFVMCAAAAAALTVASPAEAAILIDVSGTGTGARDFADPNFPGGIRRETVTTFIFFSAVIDDDLSDSIFPQFVGRLGDNVFDIASEDGISFGQIADGRFAFEGTVLADFFDGRIDRAVSSVGPLAITLRLRDVTNERIAGTATLTLTRVPDSFGPSRVLAIGAIPEPATWAMMIAGFGLVGSAMRRRTRFTATA